LIRGSAASANAEQLVKNLPILAARARAEAERAAGAARSH
jgi:hypothetical protein